MAILPITTLLAYSKMKFGFKPILFVGLLIIGFNNLASGQSTDFKDMLTPAAPGFTLLGTEPISIQKPTTPAEFSSSLVSAVSPSGPKPNFALESTPYWWSSRPNLTFEDYYASTIRNFLKFTSISIATGETHYYSDVAGVGTAMGFRSTLFAGSPTEALNQKVEELRVANTPRTLMTDLVVKLNQHVNDPVNNYQTRDQFFNLVEMTKDSILNDNNYLSMAYRSIYGRDLPSNEIKNLSKSDFEALMTLVKRFECANCEAFPLSQKSYLDFVKRLREYVVSQGEEKRKELRKGVGEAGLKRKGFVWDIAGAALLDFPTAKWETAQFSRLGVWSTFGGAFNLGQSHSINVLAALRYFNNYKFDIAGPTNNFDFGVSLQWSYHKLLIAAEGLLRTSGSANYKDNFKYDLNLQYKFSEDIHFRFSYGKNFDQATGAVTQNLISLFGLSYDLKPSQVLSRGL